jgi:hypothetical protein
MANPRQDGPKGSGENGPKKVKKSMLITEVVDNVDGNGASLQEIANATFEGEIEETTDFPGAE